MKIDHTVGSRPRIHSVDLLRGLVMIIMALDHVRNYFAMTAFAPTDLSESSAGWFFARWITHFCAPVFVFLSGTSAWLYRQNKQATTAELARFLLSRGVWLIFIELTLITFFWQFGYNFLILQVIWAIGWSMVVLAALVFLPTWAIAGVGLALIFGHNLLDGISPEASGLGWVWNVLHVSAYLPAASWAGPMDAYVGYPLIPWIGVMAVGYAFGRLIERPPSVRDRWMLGLGLAASLLFVVLRATNLYGESGLGPADAVWTDHGRGALYAFMSFINTTKYPPSLLYLLMTLGPALMLMPLLERWRGAAADFVTVFGRVPFLFYVLHLPLIHASSVIWTRVSFGQWGANWFNPAMWPPGYEPSLWRAYLVWALVIAVLYWPCKAFMEYRKRHTQWWLSYI